MLKKILFSVATLLVVTTVWYLFIKPSDYIVNFKVKTTPGTVIQTIKTWNFSLPNSKILTQYGTKEIVLQRTFGDSIIDYTYQTQVINDSITKVSVGITDTDHSLINRLTVPFSNTTFKKRSTEDVQVLYEVIDQHLKEIKIEITGKAKTPATYYAYVSIKSLQHVKTSGMMENYGYISDVLLKNDVELNGTPFVEITNWDMETDSISYNFCFPIIRSEKLPIIKNIKYKRLFEKEAIHAVYHGHYMTSDRAWYTLLAYAEKNNLEVEKKPIEVFFNNPNMGGNELEWKADIYMPLKVKNTSE